MFRKRLGATFDRIPAKAGLPLGLSLGALGGALLLLAPSAVGVPGFLLLSVAAGLLAWSGEPVEVLPVPPPRVEPAPEEQPEKGVRPAIEMVAIPTGRFLMGSPEEEEGRFENEGPIHEVRILTFLCMRTPVTRRLYAEVVGADPGWPEGEADDRPVNKVNWLDAVEFCNRLSEREGWEPCYDVSGDEVTWRREARGYRLPTEAEWEYACRAGTRMRWSFGDDEARLAEHVWFAGNAGGEPQPVGWKKPNPWGLCDIHGNVLEWCWDWYSPYEPWFAQDPAGPAEGAERVLRGGSYLFPASDLRSAGRDGFPPVIRLGNVGFRCVRGPRRQPVR